MASIPLRNPNDDISLSRQVLSKAIIRACENMSINRKTLSNIIGISEASISRLFESKRFIDPNTKEGELALLLIRVYRSLDTLFGGNQEQSKQWLHAENYHLNGTPITMMQKVDGLIFVVSYLDAIRGKT